MSIEPIYYYNITSQEDIERALNASEQVKQEVSQQYQWWGENRFEKAEKYLGISSLFKEAYLGSLGYAAASETIIQLGDYKTLLSHSIHVCNNSITPLLISSFKCHQQALQNFTQLNQPDSAIADMEETREIAIKISSEYKKLGEEFKLIQSKVTKMLSTLVLHEAGLHSKQRDLKIKLLTEAISVASDEESILKICTDILSVENEIKTLDSAEKPFMKIITALGNMSGFWTFAGSQSRCLTTSLLANGILIESQSTDAQLFKNEIEALANLPVPRQEVNLAEVVKSMKTGREVTLTPASHFGKLVHNTLDITIEKEFKESYLGWLALAKITQEMTKAMKQTIVEVETTQEEISQVEKDPLAIALHLSCQTCGPSFP